MGAAAVAVVAPDTRMWDSALSWVSLRAERIERGSPDADVRMCEQWLRYLADIELGCAARRLGRPDLAPRAQCPRI